MPRPGTDVVIVDDAPAPGAILDTGQAFAIGVSERGPVDKAVLVSGMGDYRNTFGNRSGGSLLYGAAWVRVREVRSRAAGPAAGSALGGPAAAAEPGGRGE